MAAGSPPPALTSRPRRILKEINVKVEVSVLSQGSSIAESMKRGLEGGRRDL